MPLLKSMFLCHGDSFPFMSMDCLCRPGEFKRNQPTDSPMPACLLHEPSGTSWSEGIWKRREAL